MSATAVGDLPLARQHVVEAEHRCSSQRLLIARLAACGSDTTLAHAQLMAFEETLAHMRVHLQIIQGEHTAR